MPKVVLGDFSEFLGSVTPKGARDSKNLDSVINLVMFIIIAKNHK